MYLYFTSTNEGVCVYSNKSYDTDLPTSRSTDWEFFTFTTSGNNIEVNGEKHSFTVSKQGNYLTDSGNSSVIYEGATMSSSDWDYVESLMPITGSCGANLTYSYDKRTYWITISGTGDMYDYSKGKQPWAWSDKAIGGVTIKEGVTSIGANAFNGLVIDFSDFDVPSSLKKIGAGAFKGAIISEFYSSNVVEIGAEAFADCKYLKKIYLMDPIETIGSYAFDGVTIKNTSFSLPKNLKSVGDCAFANMTMGTLTLNDKLETIGHAVFSGVTNTTLTIPNSVKSIGSNAFGGTFSKVIIGTGLETLSTGAFVSSKFGSMYVNLGIPLDVDGIYGVTGNDSEWTLYVPKGSKSAYANKAPWKNFKAIYEDASLVSGNGEPENSGTGSDTQETTGKTQDHDWVDMGLPSGTKWATCNVGASSVAETGDYYPWGRRSPSDWDTPCLSGVPDNICGNKNCDAATYVWGSAWQTPSLKQLQELCDNCTFTKAKVSGKNVIKVTSKNNKAVIYLPLTGYKKGFYERTTTIFSSYSTSTAYLMCGEITERDDYGTSAKNYKFSCGYDDLNASCSSWFNLSTNIYSYVYKVPIRPVTK